jgi:hypothetical protein
MMNNVHDWVQVNRSLYACSLCGAVADRALEGVEYTVTRPECVTAANVLPMTLKRARQMRKTGDSKGAA